MARQGLGGDLMMRRTPYGCATAEDDDLGRLVRDAGEGGDLLRQGTLRPDVYQIGRKVRMLLQEGFDLVQGR